MILTTVGGNPDLDPEKADTVTAGIVVRPGFESPWVRDLQFTIDWYRIEIDDVVTLVDAGTAVLNCFDPTYNPAYAADNYWCTLFGRDPATGEIVGAVDTFYNLATSMTSGVDFQLDWSLPVGPGELGVGWYVGWLDEFDLQTTSERTCGAVRRNDRRLLPAPIPNGSGLPICATPGATSRSGWPGDTSTRRSTTPASSRRST